MKPILLLLVFAGTAAAQQPDPASARAMPRSRILDAARDIDALVERDLARRELRANPQADAATFVRRAYLAIAGRIPTVAETEAFLRDKRPLARHELIDTLLDSPGHTSHAFNWWADLLRVKSRLAQQVSGEPYAHWLKDAIARNVPYDELVTELLTAEGPAHARGNGATGYLMRDRGMPEDNMANTVRVFLGTRLECAQCHDHRFDKWKQRQFFEMVAFTGGIRYDEGALASGDLRDVATEVTRKHGRNGLRALGLMLRPVRSGIYGSGMGVARLPQDYQYDDAAPNAVVEAKTIFGPDLALHVAAPPPARRPFLPQRQQRNRDRASALRYPEIDSRATFAQWMTSPTNPRFARVIANRLWKKVMGRGLIEPVDDLRDDTVASDPALMDRLERLIVELDYDLKQFERVLLSTELFAREAARATAATGGGFPGPLLRRMTAEQIWDSMLTLAVPDLDATLLKAGQRAGPVYAAYEQLAGADPDTLLARVDVEVLRYTDPERFRQARRQDLMQRARDAMRPQTDRAPRRGGGGAALARASDLPSPAPPGHFLRQFGQSDREQIEAASDEANVPQVLTMLNGFVETRVLADRNAPLTRALEGAKNARDKIAAAFVAVLSREPSRDELAMWSRDAAELGPQAYRDLVWTLVNTHEFRFVR
jgi:hypothetical protein